MDLILSIFEKENLSAKDDLSPLALKAESLSDLLQ